jgi:hypothetical protein
LDIEELWEFEKNKPNRHQVRGPAVDLSIVKDEKSTVV